MIIWNQDKAMWSSTVFDCPTIVFIKLCCFFLRFFSIQPAIHFIFKDDSMYNPANRKLCTYIHSSLDNFLFSPNFYRNPTRFYSTF